MINDDVLKQTAESYSKYITNIDLEEKLQPVNKAMEDMLTRLEEFETMFTLAQPDIKDSKDIIKSILDYKPEFEELCLKIDSIEFMTVHIKNNLTALETKIEETENQMGIVDTKSRVTEKVAHIFTPLFKKSFDKKAPTSSSAEIFKTEHYFQ
ncbi:hypothetical protein ABEB36_000888 [Hypothenemus hampei]|uniref:Biogenesis of lysosome-related organelles complex 1 subunit 4 n=1 Tax=Hypothenemus hampei TaxID=57062 RepID=A0ABD1FCS9_HYPHA